jgi:hypothetical protein
MMRSAEQSPQMDVDRLSFTQSVCVLGTALTLSLPLQGVPKEQWQPRLLQDLRQDDSLLPEKRRREELSARHQSHPDPLCTSSKPRMCLLCFLIRAKPGKIFSVPFMAVTFFTRFFFFEWH